MEQRLVDIELKVIGLEDTVHQLNEQVYEQRKQIDELRALCRILLQQNESSAEALRRVPADERPPHY